MKNIDLLPPLPRSTEEKLDLLVRASHALGIEDVSFTSYCDAISRMGENSIALTRSLNRLKFVEQELQTHLIGVTQEHELIKGWKIKLDAEISTGENAASIERRRDALLRKAKDYHKELESILANMPSNPPVSVTQLIQLEEKNKATEQELNAKRLRLEAFQGLPPNLELARHELRSARKEQMKLIELRERLLDKMADRVS